MKISYLRVRVFRACRLRYSYQYGVGRSRLKPRLRPGDTAGSLVHRVLFEFFQLPPTERSAETLTTMFNDAWDALSPRYLRMPEAPDLRKAAEHQISNFASAFDLGAAPFALEPYLEIELEPGITLFGRPDRIDEEPGGSLHLIDYKTGEQPSEIEPGQLVFYAIMTEAGLGRTVSKASFWFLDDGTTWTMALPRSQIDEERSRLVATIHEMQEATEFPATIAPHCGYCPYLYACEFRSDIAARRAQEGW